MVLDTDVENMFKEIAASLGLEYQKTGAPGGNVHNLFYKGKFLVRFNYFVDSRESGKINILVNFGKMSQKPLSWGSYKQEELRDKAKRTITAKITELIEKK